jgi:aldehyde:ferredoxin oxidoreductase
MTGYTGKILFVDLSARSWHEEHVPDNVYQSVLAGLGLGVQVLSERIPEGADPLGSENILGFMAGILCGTEALFTGRWMVVGKSPLTGGWGDSNCGGNFGPAIKHCGYDGIFISGTADQPVIIYADGQKVEIRPADHLWGKDALETEYLLTEQFGKTACSASIGPAGEKLSLLAGIVNDHGRLAARSGLGAVMGSKKLKAVVLNGSLPVDVKNPNLIKEYARQVTAFMPKGDTQMPSWLLPIVGYFMGRSKTLFRKDGLMSLPPMRKWGTASGNEVGVANGDAPIRNWRGLPRHYRSKTISADGMIESGKRKYHCASCPLSCGAIIDVNGRESHRPEYETAAVFGPLVLNQDRKSIFEINDLLNRAGMDSISAGAVVAFAIDCFENGVLSEADTGGLRLRWGDSEAIQRLVAMIVQREGIGDLLADGVQRASTRLGRESERYAFHAGGQEIPMHDPRYDPGYGLLYIADPTPGRHTIASSVEYELFRPWTCVSWAPPLQPTYPAASLFETSQRNVLKMAAGAMLKMVFDGAGYCMIGAHMGIDRLKMFESLNAATGWEKTPDEYMEIGRHIQTLRQRFNFRHGYDPAAVGLPPLLAGHPPLSSGPLKGKQFNPQGMRRLYWQAMGWDAETGRPQDEEFTNFNGHPG